MTVRYRPKEDRQSPYDQLEVAKERPPCDVEVIELHHLLERNAAAAVHLPRPRAPRLQIQALAAPRLHVPVLIQDQGPRADQAHLPTQHVEELRQLVERIAPQPAPEPRHPRVVRD